MTQGLFGIGAVCVCLQLKLHVDLKRLSDICGFVERLKAMKVKTIVFSLGLVALIGFGSLATSDQAIAQVSDIITPQDESAPKTPAKDDELRFGKKPKSITDDLITGPTIPDPNGFDTSVPSYKIPTIIETPTKKTPTTKAEIAKEIAPFFDTSKDYKRLTQCYGTADFIGALMRVRANQTGAPKQLGAIADQIGGMQAQMQPFVLASSTVFTEQKFRNDYDLIAKGVKKKVFGQKDMGKAMQPYLKTLDACGKDIYKWRGGQ